MPVEDAVQRIVDDALAANLELRARGASVEQRIAALDQARARYLPVLDLAARYSVADGGRTIEFPVGDLLNPVYATLDEMLVANGQPARFPRVRNESIELLRSEEQETALVVEQPLYEPRLGPNVEASRQQLAGSQAELAALRARVVRDARTGYYRWLGTRQSAQVLDATRESADANLKVNQSLYDAGRITRDLVLRAEADRFLFNQTIPFAQPIETSRADIPEEPFALATTAAGFGLVRLSPLHGALVAAIIANGGVFVPPDVVASTTGAVMPTMTGPRRVLDERVAAELAAMMRTTVTEGTGRRAFRAPRSRMSSMQGLTVAGKTGSLSEANPFRDYSWFVGFAPAENPKVAFAVVVVNDRNWRVKAPYVARAAVEAWADWESGKPDAPAPRVRARKKP